MKQKFNWIVGVLIALSFILTALVLCFLPDTVPAHYNFAGEIDRYGSKYEYLLFPVVAATGGGIFTLCASKTKDAATSKILYYTAIFEVLFFTAMGFYYMWKGNSPAPAAANPFAGMKLLTVGMGILLVILGNVMPKARKNALFGLRTKWSMSSDEVWRKSQRFGGFASVTAGAAVIVLGLLLDGVWSFAALMAVVLVWCAVCCAASYRFYRAGIQ